MTDSTLEGGCLCGHIRYRASGPPHSVYHCHCEQCRRYTGAVFATGVRSVQKISPGYMTSPAYTWVVIYADIPSVQNVAAQLHIIGLLMMTYG